MRLHLRSSRLRGKLTGLALAIAAFAGGSPAWAQQGTVSIRGTVTDRATERPIANAVVLLVERSTRAATDPDGNYQFRDLPAGQYTVTVRA
ncbi:MAG: carboxypeptidase regulatory-like domain-containing protein, partial [Gemmatimonadales bacterium]